MPFVTYTEHGRIRRPFATATQPLAIHVNLQPALCNLEPALCNLRYADYTSRKEFCLENSCDTLFLFLLLCLLQNLESHMPPVPHIPLSMPKLPKHFHFMSFRPFVIPGIRHPAFGIDIKYVSYTNYKNQQSYQGGIRYQCISLSI